MKFKGLMLGLASVAALGMASVPAANATVTYEGQYTYLGDYTVPPGTPNSDSFARDQADGFPQGAFDDYWIFNIDPDASMDLSVNFVPRGAITDFIGGIYNASGWTCTAGSTCSGGSIGSLIKDSGVPGIAFPGISAVLAAGQYAVRVQGTSVSDQTSYTGQIAFNAVPEPGSLALLGLGLIGLGAARRRRA